MIKNHILYNDYSDWTFEMSGAEGSYIYDSNNKKYIDFTSGWNVANLGWNNPEVTDALIRQAKKNTYAPMYTSDPIQEEFAQLLTNSLPKNLDTVGRATGGTEANEEALKTARAYTGRKKIIGFKDTYHGQSFGTMSIGYLPAYVESISPLVDDFIQIDFPKTFDSEKSDEELLHNFSETLESFLAQKDIAAIITEAGMITGWGSAFVAPKGYLKIVRDLTEKYGTLLILDEVGTGFSRMGSLFGMELENVIPDIATFAKGLSNGAAAIGAMVTSKKIAEETYKKTNVTSTFGWMPPACAASLKTLEIHKRDRVWETAKENGKYLFDALKKELTNNPLVVDVRGIGMEMGIQFVQQNQGKSYVDQIVVEAAENGLHIVSDHSSVIQIMPPLITEKNILDQGIQKLTTAVKHVQK